MAAKSALGRGVWRFKCLALLTVAQITGCGPEASPEETSATSEIFGADTYSQLTINHPRPYNAVGFLNNGCTAFLIDADHIVAAAHCFVNGTNGAWQTGLRFYPNFHPDRVAADPLHVPRADVTRVVVGTRVAQDTPSGLKMWEGLWPASDWGIARVGNWQDTAGVDLTPMPLSANVPSAEFTGLRNPAFSRHHLPYNDNDSVTWDNMEWDTANCGWVMPENGLWTVRMRPAPFFDGTNRDTVGCNSRWSAGMIHDGCWIRQTDNDLVLHNCDTSGGSSGSPLLYEEGPGHFVALGVTHGFSVGGFAKKAGFSATLYDRSRLDQMNASPSVERFRNAPRFAANVAVGRSPTSSSATAVYAVDSDRNMVVYRARQPGTAPTPHAAEFTWWRSLGSPGNRQLGRIAACQLSNGRPQIFVVANDKEIFTRYAKDDGNWTEWTYLGPPAGSTSVADLDAGLDGSGRCQLFMVERNGKAFARSRVTDTTWTGWRTVAQGQFNTITTIRAGDGMYWVALLDKNGGMWRTYLRADDQWVSPQAVAGPPGVTAWHDIDITWDEAGRAFLVAYPTAGGSKLHFKPIYGGADWGGWRYFDTPLWAPQASGAQPSPAIRTLTASRWMEDAPGTTSPVVFATDDQGNVYLIEYKRVGTPGWSLAWKSFYNDRIPY